MTDIITAIATPFGTSALAIIRVSGEGSIAAINQIFKGKNLNKVPSHTVSYGHILDENQSVIDEVMITVFKAPKTFTKEDMVEITTHGGILVTQKVLERILSLNIRMAEPGEFSQRAYLNGRINLMEAEAIMDLIHAKNEQAMKIAHLGLNKSTTTLIENLRETLIHVIANIEVTIDYPEYDDTAILTEESIMPMLQAAYVRMEEIIEKSNRTRLIKEGIKTAIVGKPNVGKSSLLNALIEEDKAIVTDIAGTTRDIIEAQYTFGNMTLNLIDTAGIRESLDVVEKIGIERSKKAIEEAELILMVIDVSQPLDEVDEQLLSLTQNKNRIIVGNKADLDQVVFLPDVVTISALDRSGFKTLENHIISILSLDNLEEKDYNYLSSTRQIQKLKEAKQSLKQAIDAMMQHVDIDLYLIDVTHSWKLLGEITGAQYDDELLDQLFSKFCLGK